MRGIGREDPGIEHARRAIDIPDVAVVRIAEPVQVRQQVERRIGPEFGPERMRDIVAIALGAEATGCRVVEAAVERVQQAIGPFGYRAFVDSAPVLEKAVAEQAGLGWIGKNTLVINRKAGSWFFLGELFVDLPLPVDPPHASEHCGRCSACLDICPTQAFVAPYVLDARRCISYLTIELKGPIPEELRPLIGNRVFGCDDCQIVCPWNRFARPSEQGDFQPRHQLDSAELASLFRWTEEEFLSRTEGSPLRRAGYERWLRNLAVGLGNAPGSITVIEALELRREHPSELVREHVHWALSRHGR